MFPKWPGAVIRKACPPATGALWEWTRLDLSSIAWGENPGDGELVRAPLAPLCAQLWSVPGRVSGGGELGLRASGHRAERGPGGRGLAKGLA